MRTIAELTVTPMGVGPGISSYVAEVERVLQQSGLKTQLHACGTNVEGELEDVLRAVRECHEAMHTQGAPRVSTTISIGTRTDHEDSLDTRVHSVEAKMHS